MAATTLTLDRYVIDTLMADLVAHDRKPSAFLVYLAIAAASDGSRGAAMSHAELAQRTGLSKRSVQAAIATLKRRSLIRTVRRGPTEAAQYEALTPWRR